MYESLCIPFKIRNLAQHNLSIVFYQFSEENANKMKKIYGEFCSHQKEAVNLFKELQQNKKFQNFIKVSAYKIITWLTQ